MPELTFLGRALRNYSYDVKSIPGQFVKPFVKSNKNDVVDDETIAEAVDRFVPIKTDDSLTLRRSTAAAMTNVLVTRS